MAIVSSDIKTFFTANIPAKTAKNTTIPTIALAFLFINFILSHPNILHYTLYIRLFQLAIILLSLH